MTADVVIGIEILGDNAIEAMTRLAGPTNPAAAKQQAPQSWRARFGSQGAANAVHVSGDQAAMLRECDFFFSQQVRSAGFTA